MLDDLNSSSAEEHKVNRLVMAYSRLLAKDLREACAGDRVFLIITAPVRRFGKLAVAGNITEGQYEGFLRFVLKNTTGEVEPTDVFEFRSEE